ncbi:hypothetical protein G7009_12805 [Pseudomonas capeferrum]|uniref:hypothetical protein n=1 Tax=Pseudomonas capeferrum TaxID=1495066 RepID=UPI0015E2BD5C|nr:hypothetical protein [Pseudomonas capeferrum]MBA1202624.1 hypothetical protein [Pseudomonas capeferrum]
MKGQRDTENPFAHLSRKALVAMLEDESGAYTKVERYAAWEAIHDLDNAGVRRNRMLQEHEPDRRPDLLRTLEYIDNLSELEQMRNPPGYREFFVNLLNQGEALESGYEPPSLPSLLDILQQIEDVG